MAVLTSPPRTRPRFGRQAGLVAAIRGVAFTGLMLAALSAVIIVTGLIEFIGPELTREIPPPAFDGLLAISSPPGGPRYA